MSIANFDWKGKVDLNQQPVIGILSQTLTAGVADGYTSYIMAAYVDYIKSSGARVVPIIYGEP